MVWEGEGGREVSREGGRLRGKSREISGGGLTTVGGGEPGAFRPLTGRRELSRDFSGKISREKRRGGGARNGGGGARESREIPNG